MTTDNDFPRRLGEGNAYMLGWRPRDTDKKSWKRYIDMLRAMAPERRLELAADMSEGVRALTRAGRRGAGVPRGR